MQAPAPAGDACRAAATTAVAAPAASAAGEHAEAVEEAMTWAAVEEAVLAILSFFLVMGLGQLWRLAFGGTGVPESGTAAPPEALDPKRCRGAGHPPAGRSSGKADLAATPPVQDLPRRPSNASSAAPAATMALPPAALVSAALAAPGASLRRRGSISEVDALPRAARAETDTLAAAVREGRAAELPWLLDEAFARSAAAHGSRSEGEVVTGRHLLSSLRACAAWRQFGEALAAYDHVGHRLGAGSPAIWSLLLYAAAEAKEFHRCQGLFDRLCEQGSPTGHDLLNMVRYHAHCRDLAGLRQTLARLRQQGCQVDPLSRNRALSACCSRGALDLMEVLIASPLCPDGPDAVAFNTLMKGYANAGHPTRCFELYEEMRAQGIAPSETTFGILLDACHTSGNVERARRVFRDLRASGLPLNVVHYTTFMKVLVSAGHVADAGAVLAQMQQSQETPPDLVSYSMLVKAYADRGNVADAMATLEEMVRRGVQPDDVVLHIVLGGCSARRMEPAQTFRVLERLVSHGLKPSTVTLSILLKALVNVEAWADAHALLAPSRPVSAAPGAPPLPRAGRQPVPWLDPSGWLAGAPSPEPRLFAQLAQACAKAGRGAGALSAYAAMVEGLVERQGARGLGEAVSARLLQICAGTEEADAAMLLHRAVMEASRMPEPAASKALRAAAAAAAAHASAAASKGQTPLAPAR